MRAKRSFSGYHKSRAISNDHREVARKTGPGPRSRCPRPSNLLPLFEGEFTRSTKSPAENNNKQEETKVHTPPAPPPKFEATSGNNEKVVKVNGQC
jgi:hypothetical protein